VPLRRIIFGGVSVLILNTVSYLDRFGLKWDVISTGRLLLNACTRFLSAFR